VALAPAALAELRWTEVRWIPAGQPWQKARPITPAVHREAMVRLAIAARTALRAGPPRDSSAAGPSYTLDTVREPRPNSRARSWFLLIGQDQYAGLHTWRDWPTCWARGAGGGQPPGVRASRAEVLRQPHRWCRCRCWTSRPPTSASGWHRRGHRPSGACRGGALY
jgi:nicotinate-nucleotide adenylyltransferase